MLNRIKEVFNKIAKSTVIDKEAVERIIRELQKTLILADVNVKLVQEISKKVREKALEEKLPPGVSRKEQLTTVLYDELANILGGEEYSPKLKPHKILLVGLYGSGKTTTAGKLAKYYSKRGFKTCLISTDTWRPAAFEQLKQIGKSINIPVFGNHEEEDAVKILREALEKASKHEVVIVDSAGRDSLNDELIKEIKKINDELKPEEIFLVISADIGQTATKQTNEFNKAVGLTGVIVTKADSSGKAGGALSACHAAGVPVAFIGTGEKVDDFEAFSAKKFVSKLLGMPDIASLIRKMQEAAEETEFNPEDLLREKYTLKSFYKQLEATKKMGPLKKVMEMMGLSMPQNMIETSEEKMKQFKSIMDSMTKQELENPELIKSSRVKRIARGAGVKETEVKQLLKQFEMSKKMLGKIKKGKVRNMQAMMKKFGMPRM